MSKKHKNSQKQDNSPRIEQRDKLKEQLFIKEFPWTDKQKELISAILNKENKIIFINGVAGTGKTLLTTYCGLKLLNEKKLSNITYVRSVAESSSKSLGYLKGELSEKFAPFLMPLEDKLDELLHKSDKEKLMADSRIEAIPVNYLRGASFNCQYLFIEEAQNYCIKELTTIITRLGKFSKMVICGDSRQSDINNSGFAKVFNVFNNAESKEKGIVTFELTKADIMRNEILGFIIDKLDLIGH